MRKAEERETIGLSSGSTCADSVGICRARLIWIISARIGRKFRSFKAQRTGSASCRKSPVKIASLDSDVGFRKSSDIIQRQLTVRLEELCHAVGIDLTVLS